LENAYLKTERDRIVDLGQGRLPKNVPVADYGDAALIPSLVNAHTHLELCALKGRISWAQGFKGWVAQLLRQRGALEEKDLKAAAAEGVTELIQTGCVGIGEISSLGLTREICLRSGLSGIWFREMLGDRMADEKPTDSFGNKTPHSMSLSLAVHGPHTCSPELVKTVFSTADIHGYRVSIHLAESEDEHNFITTGRGAWADFLADRGIDVSGWGLPAPSPVIHLDRLGVLSQNTLAVHLLTADNRDIEILKHRKVQVCVCPRSNWNLHGRLPDIPGMFRMGFAPCLGTDSTASVDSLNLFEEMAFVSKKFPQLAPSAVLAMATVNGAAALGLERWWGSLYPGKFFRPVAIQVTAGHPQEVLERLVGGFLPNKRPGEMIVEACDG
jgi:cytosine/adenosine deaminase-related metal-dependent hydrolase